MKTIGGSRDHLRWIKNVLTNPKACEHAKKAALRVAEERGVDISQYQNVVRFPR